MYYKVTIEKVDDDTEVIYEGTYHPASFIKNEDIHIRGAVNKMLTDMCDKYPILIEEAAKVLYDKKYSD